MRNLTCPCRLVIGMVPYIGLKWEEREEREEMRERERKGDGDGHGDGE